MPHRLDTDERVHIYMDEFYCLHNFSAFRLKWRGHEFDTSEHAYHWEKFPREHLIRKRIEGQDPNFRLASVHDVFRYAERMKCFRCPDWEDVRVGVMKKILLAKYEQHEYVRRKLKETGGRLIVEDSWRDPFWGWGPDRNGLNMLGKLWMQIREEVIPWKPPNP